MRLLNDGVANGYKWHIWKVSYRCYQLLVWNKYEQTVCNKMFCKVSQAYAELNLFKLQDDF